MAAELNVNDDDYYRNSRTRAPFRPQKSGKGSTNWQLKQFAEATLGSGSLRKAVKLPEGEDEGEWLAVNGMSAYASTRALERWDRN
jgi:MOB kinase activator 1